MERGDVKALDAQGWPVKCECALQLEERLVSPLVSIARAYHVAHEGMAGVSCRHLEEVSLLAALGPVDATDTPTLVREPLT